MVHGLRRFSIHRSCPETTGGRRPAGLVLLQIDGLSHTQLLRALGKNRLPFLRRLIENKAFNLRSFYSGLPSATPAVQAELFFGVKAAVPAFQFVDRLRAQKFTMGYPWSVDHVAKRLENAGVPLLNGGRSYANIYAGGAQQARYCVETMDLDSLLKAMNPLRAIGLLLWNVIRVFRIAGYAFAEGALALIDFLRGVIQRKNIFKEFKFIPTRIFLCIILRELIRIRIKMDISDGVPIIHANFLGYDEQAHRRNPRSAFAHWTLKGIDAVVGDIWKKVEKCKQRDYRLIIYSDHGQESVRSYPRVFGKTVESAIFDALDNRGGDKAAYPGNFQRRMRNQFNKKTVPKKSTSEPVIDSERIQIAAMGPLGHVYLHPEVSAGQKRKTAMQLVQQAHIPLVLFTADGRTMAANVDGLFDLQEFRAYILGRDHPFLDDVAMDLEAVCRHPDAGDLVISGWSPHAKPLSFATENGGHGGPGKEECRGFVLMPPDLDREGISPFRALDLRRIVRSAFDNGGQRQ